MCSICLVQLTYYVSISSRLAFTISIVVRLATVRGLKPNPSCLLPNTSNHHSLSCPCQVPPSVSFGALPFVLECYPTLPLALYLGRYLLHQSISPKASSSSSWPSYMFSLHLSFASIAVCSPGCRSRCPTPQRDSLHAKLGLSFLMTIRDAPIR